MVPEEPGIPVPTVAPVGAAPTLSERREQPSGTRVVEDAEATMGEEDTRDLLYRFWNLTNSQRRDIVTLLGLLKEGEIKLPEPERYGRALIRAAELQIMDKVAAEVAKLEN